MGDLLPVVGLGGGRISSSPAAHLHESYSHQALIHHRAIILANLLCRASDLVSHDPQRCALSTPSHLCIAMGHRHARRYGLCSRVLGAGILL
jgi:hypothetical protein